MNARGLMELILLNIGLQSGIITPRFFTMMVIMAVATTLMTAPLFEMARRQAREA
jgi:Kef-type K+ transport system membrane component KefB